MHVSDQLLTIDMSHLTPMNNAVGRFVCQLKRLTLQYCKNGGSSKGIRWARCIFNVGGQ